MRSSGAPWVKRWRWPLTGAAAVAAAVVVAAWVVPTFFASAFVSVQVALHPDIAAGSGERALVLPAGALAPSRRATIALTITNHYPIPVDLGFRGNAFRVEVVRVGERGAGGRLAWQTSVDDRVLEQQVDSPGPAGSERVVRLAPGARTVTAATIDLGANAALEATGTYRLTAWGYGIGASPVSFSVVTAAAASSSSSPAASLAPTADPQPSFPIRAAPAHAEESVAGDSFSISPGFFKATEAAPRLARDPARWAANVRDMIASGAPWQLVTTFSEWGEGTAVEDAAEWQTASGYGAYLDVLHRDGAAPRM